MTSGISLSYVADGDDEDCTTLGRQFQSVEDATEKDRLPTVERQYKESAERR
jgi:hypothetical protein